MYDYCVTRRNPPAVPSDTTPEAWRLQMKAIGELTPQQCIAIWEETQRQFAIMEEAAMRRLHPDFNDYKILVELVRARYGDELASKVTPKPNALASEWLSCRRE